MFNYKFSEQQQNRFHLLLIHSCKQLPGGVVMSGFVHGLNNNYCIYSAMEVVCSNYILRTCASMSTELPNVYSNSQSPTLHCCVQRYTLFQPDVCL